jgi:hypothetical protein
MTEQEIKDAFGDKRILGASTLQTLLTALRITAANHHFKAAEHVEQAIYAFRESERDNLMYDIQSLLRRDQ